MKNFVYPNIPDEAYHFGGGQIVGNILRPDGDWRAYLPPSEEQRRNGIESSSCFIEAQQHTLATILEEQFDLVDQNFSARFNLIYSHASPSGGDPLVAAETFRKRGLIPDSLLPFSDLVKSWEEFCSFLGGSRDECEKTGKEWRAKWSPKYDIVVKREMDIDTKYQKLKEALKYSPVPFSVAQGYDNGLPKPKGSSDIHFTELVYIDDKDCPYIWDTYQPYLKKLAPKYNPDFAMRWTVEKEATQAEIGIFVKMLQAIQTWLNAWKAENEPVVQPEPVLAQPQPVVDTQEAHGSYLLAWAEAIRDYEGKPGDLSYKNNNPGNLRSKTGPFLKFKTWDEGWKALLDYLTRAATGLHKAYKPTFTLLQFFKVYSPTGDNNNPDLYAQYVAKRIGVPITTQIKDLV